MRLGTKLRRVVTLSTATNKLRQTGIADYERKFRVAIQDCKSITALLDKIQEASAQHLKVYEAVSTSLVLQLLAGFFHCLDQTSLTHQSPICALQLSEAVGEWMVHPEKKEKQKMKEAPMKTVGKKDGESQTSLDSVSSEEDPPVVQELTEIENISKYVDVSVASYTQKYETDVKIPIKLYENQVTTVLKTMILRARESLNHLEHYESKVFSLQSQLEKLQKVQANATAIEKCSCKLERNQDKLNSAQNVYDGYMIGLEQCSQKLDQMAADIWPLMKSVLSVEKSYTREQMETVQSKLMEVVTELTETSSVTMPSLESIMSETMTKVQPANYCTKDVERADLEETQDTIEKSCPYSDSEDSVYLTEDEV